MVESLDDKRRRRRYAILYSCMILCAILAAITGFVSGRHYGRVATAQNVKILEQERLTCLGNTTLLKLLQGSLARQRRALKVDPPAKKKIDAAAVKQIGGLVAGYQPATRFCAVNHQRSQ